MLKVMVDAGHGGKDSGAVAHGLAEKDVALRLARYVRDELADYEITVYMTRDNDTFLELGARAAKANQLGVDLFVSLHCNAGGGQGFESYIHPAAKTATVAIQNVIHGEVAMLLRKYGLNDRGKKRANFAVLRETKMPAILLENLFIDNARENGLLKNDGFLRELAAAIARGIVKALGAKPKPKPTTPTKTAPAKKKVYRVQVGSFADRKNAERLMNELKARGYRDAFIIEAEV